MHEEEVQLRTEVMLLVRVAEAVESGSGEELAGALDAAAAAGLLGEDELERLRSLAEGAGRRVDAANVSAAEHAALERLLERLGRETVAAGRSPEASLGQERLEGAIEAAKFMGVEVRRSVGSYLGFEEAVDEGPWEPEPLRPSPLLHVKAVVPGPPERNGSRVVCVECYDGGLVLDVAVSSPSAKRCEEAPFIPDVEVSDDLGTSYISQGGSGSDGLVGDRHMSSWRCVFSGALPPQARTLLVRLGGEQFEIEVAGIAERPAI